MSSSHLLIVLSVRFDVVFIAAIRSRHSLSKMRKYSINRMTERGNIFHMNGIDKSFCVAVTEAAICERRMAYLHMYTCIYICIFDYI